MSKRIIIAEKPSVANDIAAALGGMKKLGDYFEGDKFLVASAIGHLLELYNPEEDGPVRKKTGKAASAVRRPAKWSLASLPVLPAQFKLRPANNSRQRLALLGKLARRDDVGGIVNACDAGREGELIFHQLTEFLQLDKSVERLWLQSMTPGAIRDGIAALRSQEETAGLRAAAVSRQEADWLIGINATRALTALNSKDGGFLLTTAGRVQTPTLAMIVARELKRNAHVPRKYWTLRANFAVAAGVYQGTWAAVRSASSGKQDAEDRNRIWNGDKARKLAEMVRGSSAQVSEQRKLQNRSAPGLLDLSSLQREANKLFSLSARSTLGAAQALYERRKLLTYPRTDSKHLTPDYVPVVKKTLQRLGAAGGEGPQGGFLDMQTLARHCGLAAAGVAAAGGRVFDAAKVSDHFAIIPTGETPRPTLPEIEQKIYDLVCRRFIAVFMPQAKIMLTLRDSVVELPKGSADKFAVFESRGRVVIEPGWMAVISPGQRGTELVALAGATELAKTVSVELEELETKPQARHTEASLLTAMESAGKMVEDEELADILRRQGGLGTPATRAGIIEDLIRNGYMIRDRRDLLPTRKAFSLLELLDGMDISELTKPELTGQWESRLQGIESHGESPENFMSDIRKLAQRIAAVAKVYDPDATKGDFSDLKSPCPQCAGDMAEAYRKYVCNSCGYFIWKTVAGRQLSPAEAEELVSAKQLGPLDGFKSRLGRAFSASLALAPKGKIELRFDADERDTDDPATLPAIGACPVCGDRVLVSARSYACAKRFGGTEAACKFNIGRQILSRPIGEEEIAMLLERRVTEQLAGFVSKRGRKFAAKLTLDEHGKLGFQFAEKKAAAGKKTAKRAGKKPAKRTGGKSGELS